MNCLIIQYRNLPPEIKEDIKGWVGFHNDCLIPVRTELEGLGSMEEIEAYHRDQEANNPKYKEYNPSGTLEGFIEAYGLKFDAWLAEQDFNMEDVERVLVEIRW